MSEDSSAPALTGEQIDHILQSMADRWRAGSSRPLGQTS